MTAIITDTKYRMSLSLIRDLADNGIDIVACGGEERPFAFLSKGVNRRVVLPDPKANPQLYTERLLDLCSEIRDKEGQKPVLLPVGAASLALITDKARRFEEVCLCALPIYEALEAANDKAQLAELAVDAGVPVPESFAPTSDDDFFKYQYPLVVKPVFGEKQGLTAAMRYVIAHTPQQAIKAYRDFTFDNTPPVVQKYLEGGGYGYSVIADRGEIVNAVCHKRLREYPVSGGPSTCCVTVDGGFLKQYAEKLVKALNFTGPAMIEFKMDKQGHPYLLEINPRLWGTFPLTRVSGSSMAYDWFAVAAKKEPKRIPPTVGKRMYYLPSDMRRGLSCLKSGQASQSLTAFKELFSPHSKEGVFEWSDPRASLAYLTSYLQRGRQ